MFDPGSDRWPEIQATLRVEEVLDALGVEATSVRGDEWFAHCPLPSHHGVDANPSFSVNTDKLIFSCFSCGIGGTPIKLAMQILSIGYEEALDWLAQFSDFTVYDDAGFLDQVQRKLAQTSEVWREKSESVLPWYPLTLVDDWAAVLQSADVWEGDSLHLDGRDRLISREVASHLRLGLSAEHRRGSYVGPALIIPVMVDGDCVGWQERWLGDRPDWVPKYTNTTDFPRAFTVYNQSVISSGPDHLIVVESPMTVARLLTAGQPAVATFGAKVSPGQLKLIRKLPELWLSFDNDVAGIRAVSRVLEALDSHTVCMVVPPPQHEDKADLGDCSDDQLDAALGARLPSLLYTSAL